MAGDSILHAALGGTPLGCDGPMIAFKDHKRPLDVTRNNNQEGLFVCLTGTVDVALF